MKSRTGKQNILMVNPPLRLGRYCIDYPYYTSLGIVSNAGALRDSGFSVTVADAQALPSSGVSAEGDGGVFMGCTSAELLDSAGSVEPGAVVVGLPPFVMPYVKTSHFGEVLTAIKDKYCNSYIVAADCNFSGMHYIEYEGTEMIDHYPQVDSVVKYECERVLPDFLAKAPESRCRVVECNASEVVPDDLPFPAWDLISLEHYYAFRSRVARFYNRRGATLESLRTLPALTSRGCPYNCSFCTSNPGKSESGFRAHSPEYLAKFFSFSARNYSVEKFAFLDSIPNYDADRFTAVLEILASMGIRCEFPNGLRADKLTRAHLKLLKDVGGSLKVSMESGSERMLKTIGKRLSPGEVEQVAGWCRDIALPLSIHYITGLPDEGPEDVNATLTHAVLMREKYGAEPLVQYCAPLPGSRIHRECSEKGLLKRFVPEKIYSYFEKTPVIDNPALPLEKLVRMNSFFRQRIAASGTDKVIINLTYKCSNNCIFCAVGDRAREHGDAKRYARLLREYRLRGVRLIDFDGGEPTLFPHFFNMVAMAKELGYEAVNVTTNAGKLADRSYASRFLLSGLTSVLISLHGHNAEIHDRHTRTEGSFEKTVAGIRHVVELKPDRIEFAVNTTITEYNAPFLSKFFDFILSLGVTGVNIQFLTPFGNAADYSAYDQEALYSEVADVLSGYRDRLKLETVNLLPCVTKKVTGKFEPETGKYSRDMVFADSPRMNLGHYLDGRRMKKDVCRTCEAASACSGFYIYGEGARKE